jgi:hypothetical protein
VNYEAMFKDIPTGDALSVAEIPMTLQKQAEYGFNQRKQSDELMDSRHAQDPQ